MIRQPAHYFPNIFHSGAVTGFPLRLGRFDSLTHRQPNARFRRKDVIRHAAPDCRLATQLPCLPPPSRRSGSGQGQVPSLAGSTLGLFPACVKALEKAHLPQPLPSRGAPVAATSGAGHGRRFGTAHACVSTASVRRPSAGATVRLLSANRVGSRLL